MAGEPTWWIERGRPVGIVNRLGRIRAWDPPVCPPEPAPPPPAARRAAPLQPAVQPPQPPPPPEPRPGQMALLPEGP